MSDIKFFVNSRKYLRSQVTQWHNKKATFHSFTSADKASTLVILKDIGNELKVLNEKILAVKWSEDEAALESEFKTCDGYKQKLAECIVLLEEKASRDVSIDIARSLLKSPVAPLPKFFSQDGEDLNKFLLQFEETISRFNYPDYDKLLLLKQQISGRALVLVESLEIDKQSYKEAKALLQKALASPETQKFNVIRKLTEMNLPFNKDPYEYVSQMRNITEGVKNLNIDVDTFLLYFYWNGLNEVFRDQVIQITNKTKPNLQELNNVFFDACERYKNVQDKFKKKASQISDSSGNRNSSKSTSYAVNIDISGENSKQNQFNQCTICNEIDGMESLHPLYKCTNFVTPLDKINRLKDMNACTKCGHTSHKTNECKFHFRRKCFKCLGWHFSFLCLKDCDKGDSKSNPKGNLGKEKSTDRSKASKSQRHENVKVNEVSSSNILTMKLNVLPSCNIGETILPTFTCLLHNKMLRGLRDSGCQSNFIREDLAESQNLRVIKEVSVNVSGFNTSQHYNTKLVEAPICIGGKISTIEAICIPTIKIGMKLPGLSKVVEGFVSRGYNLMDQKLLEGHDELKDIDLVLGTGSAHCIIDSTISFGKNHRSVYSLTPFGVMILGDINQIIEDLDYLPHNKSKVVTQCSTLKDSVIHKYVCPPKVGETCLLSDDMIKDVKLEANVTVLNEKGKLLENKLQEATDQILEDCCFKYTNYDLAKYNDSDLEVDNRLVRFALNETTRDRDGRLVIPLLWNGKVSHLLGTNRNLAEIILKSNLKRLKGKENCLELIDQTFKEQTRSGIIEKIDNFEVFLEDHPEHSFLPHMPVFKPDRQTTKCRVVFLSNLCEQSKSKALTVSHNQTMFSGPSLNQKISSAVLHLRFDEKVLAFDIVKAFNQIALKDTDQNKLLFFWFKNVKKKDFSLVAYKSKRLPFGLRCSPTILMLALFKILVIDTDGDDITLKELKALMYQLFYMDNGAVTVSNSESLDWAYNALNSIFAPYKLQLQQFVTNDENLQKEIDVEVGESTPHIVKLLGMCWDRIDDTLTTKKIKLDVNADTKRKILASIASNYDIFNIYGPILNRSRIFLHELQCDKLLGWDDKLSHGLLREWQNIAKQLNSAGETKIKRCVGKRSGSYRLIAFTDSSKSIYGTVIFIQDVNSKEVNFLLAKNRMVNKQLESKSIPSLEFQAISLGVEVLIDTYQELGGSSCIKPIKIVDMMLYTDSLVSLSWLNSYHNKLDKMQKRSAFIMNRLEHINKLCEIFPITFNFISGLENPADLITRAVSFKQLSKSNYLIGPKFLKNYFPSELSKDDTFTVIIPNPKTKIDKELEDNSTNNFEGSIETEISPDHLISLDRFSSFHKLVSVYRYVVVFLNKLKNKLKQKDSAKYSSLELTPMPFLYATKQIILKEQFVHFTDIFNYFESKNKMIKDIPNLVNQLNVYQDREGLLRVKSKFDRVRDGSGSNFPILLPKSSKLTEMIIRDMHQRFSHAGVYSLLAELRRAFWIPHYFSTVKKILKGCLTCKRFKEHSVKLNQSPYREFRLAPPNIPFSYVYLDYMGPYFVYQMNKKVKVGILCISCMWSRAINLKVCYDLSVKEFLRVFQLHSFEFGIPQLCFSDLGSQLTAASNVITSFISDPETQLHFEENGVKPLKFEQFYKGCSKLGSMVESCVKLTKRLIYGSIRNNVLDARDFEFFICQTIHMVNRRPVAFREALRDSFESDIPDPITPERLIHGHDLVSINIIPGLQDAPVSDPDWQVNDPHQMIFDNYSKLRNVKSKLNEIYNNEFLGTLINQAVNQKGRYKPVQHKCLQKGDLVLIKESHTKPINYPMGVIKEVNKNINGEVTGASVLKGKTREVIKRHITTLIPLLNIDELDDNSQRVLKSDLELAASDDRNFGDDITPLGRRPRRKAALKSESLNKAILGNPV